eukprot:gnl/TRDRNA2_/TRDRNA2_199461_c0_seq1.p1 gnl/TRDRNA2_/TRDRNA2_199461_c0~~gnl/TRDRNA2_/TRDRNA2_199461_c0_seq1.p1  ORF type:complete len:210 (+),score=27.49 gnl/TRDRNA2_/TRDRNA2_199461_c0_seq1:48-677(+)
MVLWAHLTKGARRAMSGARHKCTMQLRNKPVASNFWIAAFLGCCGDFGCQKYVEKREKIDKVRLAAMTCFCGAYSGAAQHYIFMSYNYLLPKMLLATQLRAGFSKSLFDNFVHVPILYIPCFYFCVGLMQGHEPQAVCDAFEREWASSSLTCAAFWTPVEAVIFGCVPAHLRVIVVNTGNIVWNTWLSGRSQASAAVQPEALAAQEVSA